MEVCESLADDPGIAMVIGASDSGKTTWIGVAARQLSRAGKVPFAIVDSDIGQSTVGPPTAIALTVMRKNPLPDLRIDCLPCHGLFFVGSVSPPGHLLQILVGTKRLVDTAVRSGAGTVLVDTTGLIDQGPGFQLKLRKIELLGPRHLVAIQRSQELEPLLAVVAGRSGLRIHRLGVAPSARTRAPVERARYRRDRLAAYFAEAHRLELEAEKLRTYLKIV
jgi:polynucleotide 5'-hydroxyl-kinase GRC3/NOL9